jgi:hypothetical protein
MTNSSENTVNAAYLRSVEDRLNIATPGRWTSFVEGRDHTSGSSLIRTARNDIELSGATPADHDFIAHARQDVQILIAEVRRLQRIAGDYE